MFPLQLIFNLVPSYQNSNSAYQMKYSSQRRSNKPLSNNLLEYACNNILLPLLVAPEIMQLQCVSFILFYLKWFLFPDQKEILYTWYVISLIMSGHLRCLPRFLAYWKLTNLPVPTKMRKFNEEQRKFIVRIFATQSSATQVRREFLHYYEIKGRRKRSQFLYVILNSFWLRLYANCYSRSDVYVCLY